MLNYLNKRRKKGQSTLEYAILIIIVIGALLSIQVYIKRGIQGRLQSAADDIGDQFSVGNMNQIKITQTSGKTRDTFQNGVTRSELLNEEVTVDLMNSRIFNTQFEYWAG